jgi:trigger factor
MNIIRENIDDINIVLKITVEKPDYEESVANALKDYRQKAVIPGFRPGKVPEGLIRKRFGKSFLAEEVNKVLTKSLSKFIVDEKLQILGEPLPNEESQKTIDFEKDENFEFVFDIGLAPEVSVILDKNSKYEYFLIKVDDEMIDTRVENYASQYGVNEPVEEVVEKATVKGDFAQLGSDGNELEGGIHPEGILLSVDMIKNESIKTNFVGKKSGDTLVFDPVKAFEDRHEVGHMLNISHETADKLESEFKFTIREINVYKPAKVNDDLIKLVYGEDSGINTIEEFRDKIKSEIAESLKQSSEYKFAIDTHKALLENIKMELPEAFLKRWLKIRNENLTDEQIEGDFDNFIKDLKWQIISDIIIKENEIKVEEEEAINFARQIALSQFYQYGMYNVTVEQIDSFAKMMMEKEEEKERIYKKLFENKIMDVVKGKTIIEEKEVSNKEFSEMVK